jgi:phage terminase small subunit
MGVKKLTRKQKRFVEEYLVDLNATQAALRAGYSKKTAYIIGHENLNKPKIKEAIEAKMREREKKTEITQERVLRELAKIAFSDLTDFVEFGPDGLTIKESSKVDGTVLSEVYMNQSRKGKSHKVKLHDKLKALELLGRHLAMFTDKTQISGEGGGAIQIQFVRPKEVAGSGDTDSTGNEKAE